MLFVDAKCCCFNSIVVYKQMSTVDFVEAPLGWTFHAELKLFALLLVLPKYMTCLIESYLQGSCSVQTPGFRKPQALAPCCFYRINRQRVQPPSSTPVKLTFPTHSSPADAAPYFCAFDRFALKLILTHYKRSAENKRTLGRKFSPGC